MQKEGSRLNVNLLTSPIDLRLVANAGIDCSSGNSSSETNNISHEINKAMDIDALIRGAHKKRKTTTGVVNVTFTSEEGGNSSHLE